MPVNCRMLGSNDEHALDHVAEGVFDFDIIPEQRQAFLADPQHRIAVAEEAGMVIGFASAVHYLHPDKPPQCWINEVSTAPSRRRQGVASDLLSLIVEDARDHGCDQIWLATEADNDPALALYRSFGATETPVVMFELGG